MTQNNDPGVILLLLMAGLVKSEWLANMLHYYHPGLTTTRLILLDLAGILMVSLIILGLARMHPAKKASIYLYIIGTLSLVFSMIIWVEADLLFLATEIFFLSFLAACHLRQGKLLKRSKIITETQ